MKTPSDPRLKVRLDAALPSPEPPAAMSRRVRQGVQRKLELERRFRARAGLLVAAVVGAVVVAMMARVRAPVPVSGIDTASPAEASVLTLRHDARVLVRAGAEVRVERDDEDGTALELRKGIVFVSVAKRLQTSFTLRCAEITVEVVGTFFGVEAKDGAITRVVVEHGAVAVRRSDSSTLLQAGDTWPPGAAMFRPTDIELTRLGELEPQPAVATPSASAALPDGATDPRERPSSVESSVEPRSADTPSSSPLARSNAEQPPPGERRRGRDGPIRKSKAPDAATDPRWQAARESELRGDFDEASRRYRELASSSKDLREDALFALGRVAQRQGHVAEALAAFEQYRDAYADGAYARSADLHMLELLVESGEKDAALRESTRFLRKYPNDARAWKFRQTRSSIYAERGDCERALADVAELVPSEVTIAVQKRCAGRDAG